jgi:hypothetical protein
MPLAKRRAKNDFWLCVLLKKPGAKMLRGYCAILEEWAAQNLFRSRTLAAAGRRPGALPENRAQRTRACSRETAARRSAANARLHLKNGSVKGAAPEKPQAKAGANEKPPRIFAKTA